MHEVALASSLLQLVLDNARLQGARSIRRVVVAIGTLSHVEPRALAQAFTSASMGTLAGEAELAIEEPPGSAWCFDCGDTVPLAKLGDDCPRCGGGKLVVNGGDEMRLMALEVL
jgi:hydrogenase nickel incorporation protein HypA/HybF